METPSLSINSCANEKDSFTLDYWEETPPSLFIRFIEPDGKSITQCYSSESLYEYLTDTEKNEETGEEEYSHLFYEWVPINPNKPLDAAGHYGQQTDDEGETYWSFPPNNVPLKVDKKLLIALLSDIPYYGEARQRGIRRLGKASSRGELGGWHGQEPGYMTYEITSLQPLSKKAENYLPASISYLVALLLDPKIKENNIQHATTLDELQNICGDWTSEECRSLDSIWPQLIERDLTKNYKGDNYREFYLSTMDDLMGSSLEKGLVYASVNNLEVLREIILNDPELDKEKALYTIISSPGKFPDVMDLIKRLRDQGIKLDYKGLVAAAIGGNKEILNVFYNAGVKPQDALIDAVNWQLYTAIPTLLEKTDFDDILVEDANEVKLGILALALVLTNKDKIGLDKLVENGLDIERLLLEEISENGPYSYLLNSLPPPYTPNIHAIVEDICGKLGSSRMIGTKHIDRITPVGVADVNLLWLQVIQLLGDECYEEIQENNYTLTTRPTEVGGKVLELKPNTRTTRPVVFD